MNLKRSRLSLIILLCTFSVTIFAAVHPSKPDVTTSFTKQDPVESFWKWFKANEKRLRNFEDDPTKYLLELLEQAKKVQPGVAIELEPPKNGIINMTISADGDVELFPIVQSMISKAPKVDGWHFFPFRQRMSKEVMKAMTLKAGDLELSADQMKFASVVEGNLLDIIVYVNGVNEDNFEKVAYGGLLLIDNILGEYDCVKKVRNYDFEEFPKKKSELNGLIPLLDLAEYVDKFHAPKK